MPPRKPAGSPPVEETTEETTEPEKVDHDSLVDVVREVLKDLGITGSSAPAEEPTETEEVEELESPRQQESRMRKEVESAIGSLHIHVDQPAKEKETKEPEQTPGRKPFLQRVIGL